MLTVPLHTLLSMVEVRPHQELLDDGSLVEYTPDMGKAIFVSHQWLSGTHPDPECQQLKVLQDALRNLLADLATIPPHATMEFYCGHVEGYTSADLTARPVFVWYDYFGCPQVHLNPRASEDVLFRSRSFSENWFIALCPTLETRDGSVVDQHSWAVAILAQVAVSALGLAGLSYRCRHGASQTETGQTPFPRPNPARLPAPDPPSAPPIRLRLAGLLPWPSPLGSRLAHKSNTPRPPRPQPPPLSATPSPQQADTPTQDSPQGLSPAISLPSETSPTWRLTSSLPSTASSPHGAGSNPPGSLWPP